MSEKHEIHELERMMALADPREQPSTLVREDEYVAAIQSRLDEMTTSRDFWFESWFESEQLREQSMLALWVLAFSMVAACVVLGTWLAGR